jgi:hypothetical protein
MSTALMDPTSDHLRECDVIMKGGITSGVVYPLAVVELSKTYRFINIGGTSAGAIAAALTAAAELGRNSSGGGFAKLGELPTTLGKRLLSLFQPSKKTRPAFAVLLSFMGKDSVVRKSLRGLGTALGFHWLSALLGAALGAALWFLLVMVPMAADRGRVGTWVVWGIAALVCGVIAGVVRFLAGSWSALNDNGFGLCNGLDRMPHQKPPLTPWLMDLLNATAGRAPSDPPLTFGDLWGPGDRDAQKGDPSRRAINLEVMTTNLTHGWPLRLPFSSHEFFFDPAELGRYFPEGIIQWMIDHPYHPEGDDLIDLVTQQTRFRPLPAPADLPVVVATRMSLSFPGLISAVPLYAVDWSRIRNYDAKKEGRAPDLERCWFSDGGIGSNFPVHFFDGLLPRRPTFGINLRPFHPDYPKDPNDESHNVRFPTATGQGVAPTWTPIPNAIAFVTAIIDTMQNWVDNTQMRLPGYRDRVVHVFLEPEEGGLNLKMPKPLIDTLMKRGKAAGDKLASEFKWDAHRWTRYLTAMSQLEIKLEGMDESYASAFRDFLTAYDSDQKPYARSAAWKASAVERTDSLMGVAGAWAGSGQTFTKNAPSPEPELRIGPKR